LAERAAIDIWFALNWRSAVWKYDRRCPAQAEGGAPSGHWPLSV